MSDRFNHLRRRASEDTVGRIDGAIYCDECGHPFDEADLNEGCCIACRPFLPPPGLDSEPHSEDETPSSIVNEISEPAACCGDGGGVTIVNRIKNLFNLATKPSQFQRLIRFIRKHKTE